jgi:hypothetical protein
MGPLRHVRSAGRRRAAARPSRRPPRPKHGRQGPRQIVEKLREGCRERVPPPHHDDVQRSGRERQARFEDRGPEPAADAVALGRMTDPLRNRKAEPKSVGPITFFVPAASLHGDPFRMEAPSGCGSQELRPLRQPPEPRLIGCRAPGWIMPAGHAAIRDQAERRLRPRARRAAITLRPPTVAMRARKPWRRLRTILLGW